MIRRRRPKKRAQRTHKRRSSLLRLEALEDRRLLTVSVSAQPPLNVPPDIANLSAPGPAAGSFDPGGNEGHIWSNRPLQGQTFTTGDNTDGYLLHAVTLQNEENTVTNNSAGFTVRIGEVTGNTFTQIHTESANNSVSYVPDDYMTFEFSAPAQLAANTVYGFEWSATGAGFTTWNNVNSNYEGGEGYSNGGGGVPSDSLAFRDVDRVFHIDLEAVVPLALRVMEVEPADGSIVGLSPTQVEVSFSEPVDEATLQASDLAIDGTPATGVNVIDEDTVSFVIPPNLPAGEHTVTLAADGIESDTGLGLEEFVSTFLIAATPTVELIPATVLSAESAQIGGTVINTGGDVPDVTLYYGTTDGEMDAVAWQQSVAFPVQDGDVTAVLEGLDAGTLYYYQIHASNIAGEAWALASGTFTTTGVEVPVIANRPATSVRSTSAVLNGEVLSTGNQAPAVTIYFGDNDGGDVAANWDQAIPLGTHDSLFSTVVSGLSPATSYYFRVHASNEAGNVWANSTTQFVTGELVPATVVINEIHYDPPDPRSPAEFIELFNAGDQVQDLSGWYFDDGIDYVFEDGTSLGPGEYLIVAQDPATILATFGADSVGPWTGGLSNEGERLRLRDANNATVDVVEYQLGYPWPTVGDDPGHSIELINPSLDNDLGGSWRSSAGDPGPAQTMFVAGSQWRYFKGTEEPSGGTDAWRMLGFDDSAWFTGATPVGYGDGHVITEINDMRGNYSTVYFRKEFDVANAAEIATLNLETQFDDGLNVWINGSHVLGVNVEGAEIPHTATTPGGGGEDATFRPYSISATGLLENGTNIITVQLVNASLSGSSDAWFDARLSKGQGTGDGPTPLAVNNAFAVNAAPQSRQVDHDPQQPVSGEDVIVTIKLTDDEGVSSAQLEYQVVEPGSYIRLTDEEYQTQWTSLPMVDDGTGADSLANDSIFTAVIPGAVQQHRHLVRYRIVATDGLNTSVTVPYADDPQPNFAYFVYDGVPDWSGSLNPGVEPVVTYPGEVMSSVATYHLIADATDVRNSQYNQSFRNVQFNATMVYDGVVYDHILYRNRGRASTYQVGKNKWKLNFNRGHAFEARDDYGRKYDVPWDKINVLPGTNPWWRDNASTEGTVLFEPAAFKLYELAGAPSPETHYFQFRIIDGAAESLPNDQYEGDNWGLYIAIEQPENEFLAARGLPDGSIFNMHGVNGASIRTQGSELPDDRSDLAEYVSGYSAAQPVSWYDENLHYESYFGWNAINLAVNNNDLRPEENVNYYHNQENDLWYTIPWDLDLTFEDAPHLGRPDSQWERIQTVLGRHDSINQMYQNRVREILDLLLDSGDAELVVQELATVLVGGDPVINVAEANQALWDYHPDKRKQGIWYDNFNGELLPNRDFASLVSYMEQFVTVGGYGRDRLASRADDANIPAQPTLSYIGDPLYSVDGLQFRVSDFSDPDGNDTFAAMEWRVAEVHNPAVANYDPTDPFIFEIEGTWESGLLDTFVNELTVSGAELETGRTYRARVRMQDDSGKFSHWSDPIEFQTSAPSNPAAAGNLVITQINYNPAAPTPAELAVDPTLSTSDFEFLQVMNISAEPISLTNVGFAGNNPVTFSFDSGSLPALNAQERAYVVSNPTAFELRFGDNHLVAGSFESGQLSDGGETITLRDANGRDILSFDYDDRAPWPIAADGYGSALELVDPLSNPDHGNPFNWHATGSSNETAVLISEVLTHTDPPLVDAIELYNPSPNSIDIGGWFLSDDDTDPLKYQIPIGTTIAAEGYHVIYEDDDADPLTDPPADFFGGAFSLSSTGDEVLLAAGDGTSLTGYTHGFSFGAAENGRSFIRHDDSIGIQHLTAQAHPGTTLGAPNQPFLVGDVVITELHYNPNVSNVAETYLDEFIEIQNTTATNVSLFDPGEPGNTWRIEGVGFSFPQDTELPPGQIALVVGIDPTTFRTRYQIDAAIPIFGPYSGALSNGGERVAIQRPDTPELDGSIPMIDVDVVTYQDSGSWTSLPDGENGDGSSLTRVTAHSFGSDPASWHGEEPTPGVVDSSGLASVLSVTMNADQVDPDDLPTGPQVTSWEQQRSELASLTVAFSNPVLVTTNDLTLTNLGVEANVEPDIIVDLARAQLVSNGNSLTITFVDRLADGVYQLTIHDSATSVGGEPLDGNADGVAGGDFVFTGNADNQFYVVASEFNGDGGVSIFDFGVFAYWFGQGVPRAPRYADLNQDNGVSIFDFPVFAERFGTNVSYPDLARPQVVEEGNAEDQPADKVLAREQLVVDEALLNVLAEWTIVRRPAEF